MRPELLAHCYRMVGSVTEAEDQVQETYLRAWRAFHSFEGRSSVRTWMYAIATNICLTALQSSARRPLPTGLGGAPGDPTAPLHADPDTAWLEPLPDAALWSGRTPDPEAAVVAREGIGLAAVAAMQELPPRQRAALILREVLSFSAAESADILGTSVAATNSALQRARATIGDGLPRGGRRPEELDEREQRVWREFCEAFERYDVPAVVGVLAQDARWEMPPFDRWYAGRQAVAALVTTQCPARAPGDLRMLATAANGLPAAGMYLRDGEVWRPFQLVVLQIFGGVVRHVVGFFGDGSDPGPAGGPARSSVDGLFARAGLPVSVSGER